jgi:hypothetical protein
MGQLLRTASLLLLLAAAGAARAQDLLFADGFEVLVPACVDGVAGGGVLPAPPLAGATVLGCFEIADDAGARRGELASAGLPVARGAALTDAELARVVVIGPGGARWPADLRVLSRWGRPLADTGAPVRWLEVALAVDLEANARTRFALLQLAAPPPAVADPGALLFEPLGPDRYRFTQSAMQIDIDARAAMPLRRLALRDVATQAWVVLFEAQPGGSVDEGLHVRWSSAAGGALLEASGAVPGSVAVDRVRWQLPGAGGVHARVHIDGHFEAPGDVDRCPGDGSALRFPWSLTLGVARGVPALDIEAQFGNACGIPQSAPDADLAQLDFAQFGWPLAQGTSAQQVGWVATDGAFVAAAPGSPVRRMVAQRRGGGTPWQRRAEATEDGVVRESAVVFANPAVAVQRPLAAGQLALAAAVLPWMRYREPQALEIDSGRIALRFVHEPVRVGKAKSLWQLARVQFDVAAPAAAASRLLALRDAANRAAARGLLPRALPADLDAAAVLPPQSGGLDEPLGVAYRQYLALKHDATIGDEPCVDAAGGIGSQWTCSRTFGAQLWPDIPFNEQFGFAENPTPALNEGKLNYWDPVQIELTEFLRAGDPRWAWDFALPQSWLMAYSAYYNFGPWPNAAGATSNIAGHSFGSGGTGDGLWHRGDSGSADYTYNRHQTLAYLLRPRPAHHDRLHAAGVAAGLRFTDTPGDDTSWAAIGRLNLQYLDSLSRCAQFVEGAAGVACDARLREVLVPLIRRSLSAGLMCERKLVPGSTCFLGQFFMLYAWYYPVLERLALDYGHTLDPADAALLHQALVRTPAQVLAGLPRNGAMVDVDAVWPNALQCQLGGVDFGSVQSCTAIPDPDNLTQNKPATLSLLLRGHARDGTLGLCAAARQIAAALFAGPDPLGPLAATRGGGWWKGAVESGQELSTAALGLARCPP